MVNITRDHKHSSRYFYDTGACSTENGYSNIRTNQDASYFGTWANPFTLTIFCYCEGDLITTQCDTAEEFVAEMRELKRWNEESERYCDIDTISQDQINRWNELGLGDMVE